VSEYQYYEFQAVDRPLTAREIAEVRRTSTRASITARKFVNEYHYGDFKGDPAKLVDRFYDGFLYLTNWYTRQVSLRLPRTSLDPATAKRYAAGVAASSRRRGDHVVLDLVSEDEAPEWDDDEDGRGVLSQILPVRDEIARGDHRALYVAWLLEVQLGDLDDDAVEPPCPPGLGKLSPALEALVDFLRIDPDLIAVAAQRSGRLTKPSNRIVVSEIAAWPARTKDDLLARLARADDPAAVQREVVLKLAKRTAPAGKARGPRTAGALRGAAGLVGARG
jgi:hypothetical protein